MLSKYCQKLTQPLHSYVEIWRPVHVKLRNTVSSVLPIVEYASTVWALHTTQDVNKIELLQRRGTWFVLNKYQRNISVTRLLNTLGWPSLKTRRSYLKIILLTRSWKSWLLYPQITSDPLIIIPLGTNTIFNTYNVPVILINVLFSHCGTLYP